jgi:hypothetical protein
LANGFGVFNYNCRSKYVKGLDKIKSGFWKTVLCTFLDAGKLTTEDEIDSGNLLSQHLWNNSLIQYKHNLLFYPEWKRQGIEYIQDIIKENEQRLLTLEEIKEKIVYDRGSIIFDYNAVVNAIPKTWLHWIVNKQTVESENERAIVKKLYQYLKKPKDLLRLIVNKDNLRPCSVGFWQHKLHIHITIRHWKVAIDSTKETRLRVLHWKILHNIYPTNILLNKMGISESKTCKHCPNEIDYIEHFFWSCDQIHSIWKQVEEHTYLKYNKSIKLKLVDVLFGYNEIETNSEVLAINLFILIAKMCISKFRYGTYFNISLLFERELRLRNV